MTTVQGVHCDSGMPTAGNCIVAGLRIDASCADLAGERLARIVDGVRDVAGPGGVGCVGRMNPALATELSKALSRNPPIAICCGHCRGAGLTNEEISNSDCALTPPPTAGGEIAVILNTGNIFGGGACGSAAMVHPERGQLLHELTHVAGVPGAGGHGGKGTLDPETGNSLDERDFLADPVFGCQYSCYGVAAKANSMRCLACANGAAASTPAQGSPSLLEQALRDLEAKAAAHDASVPARCQARWDTAGDPGPASYRAYAAGLRAFMAAAPALKSCTDAMGTGVSDRPALRDYAARCSSEVQAMREACNGFGQASGCADRVGLESTAIVARCRDSISAYESKVLGLVRGYGAVGRTAMAVKFEGFRCEDYFAATTSCSADPTLVAACQAALAAAKP